jgi:protoporphyrinogen oxidase
MASEISPPVYILGAGPAGLTAAYEAVKKNLRPVVIEKTGLVGGIARTESYRGYRFDIGGHRFFTHFKEIQRVWNEVLNQDFIKVLRSSRIYYRKCFYNYPLSFFNAISNLGVLEGLLILSSYLKAKIKPHPSEESFEQWVSNRFGRRLFETFFKTYTEKVWGIPCSEIRADWAAQRIKGMSLRSVVYDALVQGRKNTAKTLIREFHYPVFGPGMMWEKMQQQIEQSGGSVLLNAEAIRIHRSHDQILSISVRQVEREFNLSNGSFISSIPLDELIELLDPPPPEEILRAARGLCHRDFILVGLIVDKSNLFPDNWIYIHSPEVKVGRIQNFRNWSAALVPEAGKTSLGMEYFCSEGDAVWRLQDAELIQIAKEELQKLGLAPMSSVEDGVVFRQKKAYPVYNQDYRRNVEILQRFLGTIGNLQTIGRNGLHRYNNQDHSMLTAIMAVRNIQGEKHDLWTVNTDASYGE